MIELEFDNKYQPLANKFSYLLENFRSIYKINGKQKLYFGTSNSESGIEIKPGQNIINFFCSHESIPKNYTFKKWKNHRLPFLFTKQKDRDIIVYDTEHSHYIINYDLLSSAFYFISLWQEWNSNKSDKFGRFPAQENFLYKHQLLQTPVVNYYFDILKTALEMQNKKTEIDFYNNNITSFITHDIDLCKTGWKENSARALLEGHPFIAVKTIIQKIIQKDVWFNFDKIMNIEDSLDIKSTYFFIPEKSNFNNVQNGDYNIASPELKKALESIQKNGNEIGLHASYGTGFKEEKFKKETEKMNTLVAGNRFHFLGMRIPESLEIINNSKLIYDTTLGFAEQIGFRNGFCYPYPPYNIFKDAPYSFIEFPLMVMDRTLQHSSYMGLIPSGAVEVVEDLIDEIGYFRGSFILLWHNKFISGYKFREWQKVYIDIINSLKTRDSQFLLPGEFIKS